MKARLRILTGLTMAMLAGCEAPQTGTQAMPPRPPEQTIQAPAEKVRLAAIKTMSERGGYVLTPVGADTLVFDRKAEFGSTVGSSLVYGKEAWRRVRVRLVPVGGATLVTAEPSLVVDRGTTFEREEADTSDNAGKVMREILGKIQGEAQGSG